MTRPRPRLRTATLLVAAALAAGGGTSLGWALTHQEHAPQPSAAAAGHLDGAGQTGTTGATSGNEPSGSALPRSRPVSIRIPSINVMSPVNRLGLDADGSLQVPAVGPHYNEAAWYDGSPTPGQRGPAVIEGHVDSVAQGPSVFFRLGALSPGDKVYVTRADHRVVVFTVHAVRRYSKSAFPRLLVYGNTADAQLRLITCGGSFDASTGHYRDNVVAFAHLSAVRSS